MKKIMFNDKYGLTAAVLNGKKTMTRRIVKNVNLLQWLNELADDGAIRTIKGTILSVENSNYKVGEIVAVAQRYSDIADDKSFVNEIAADELTVNAMKYEHGWNNKQGVKACYMPNHIRITDVKAERLQDISDEDCMKEGIFKWGDPFHEDRVEDFGFIGATKHYLTPKEAFATLIDKVSGKGTWERNPWVFAYTFKLID